MELFKKIQNLKKRNRHIKKKEVQQILNCSRYFVDLCWSRYSKIRFPKNRKVMKTKDNFLKAFNSHRSLWYREFKGKKPDQSFTDYLNCSKQVLKKHLEGMFYDDMSWENYGKLWHIRHIVPIKTDRKVYFHYRNLKPTFNTDKYNVIKSCHKEILKKEINKPFEIQYRKSLCNFCS